MSTKVPVGEITLQNYPIWRSGKVRDIFDLGERLLFVATDRVSAFDVILPTLIPGKGELLTAISHFWFDATRPVISNHVHSFEIDELDLAPAERELLTGRSMIVRKADRIDIECVVRSRLAGSGWEEYRRHDTLAGETLPSGLRAGDSLPEPRFTPAIKNDAGHDENIPNDTLRNMVGADLASRLQASSLELFRLAQVIAGDAGFVIAETKCEFGFIDGELVLIYEFLTPDSSRYWNRADITPGAPPQGYDKQVIRDWLIESGWDREPPAPELPIEIVSKAQRRYADVLGRLQATT